jgi:hypothetical protein
VVSTSKVIEDGLGTPLKRPSQPGWGWLVAGVLIGVGASVLVLRVDQGAPTVDPTTTQPAATRVDQGISEVIEGFPDGLITTVRADGRSLEALLWPLRGEPYERTIPVGASNPPTPVDFDVSGRRMATLLPEPGEASGVLYAGVPENAAIVDSGVNGYAWHDSTARALAYTTIIDEELFLLVAADDLFEPALTTRAVGIDGSVVAWGDWGFAIEDTGDSIVLLTPDGEIKDSKPGRVLASHESGWLAIADDGLELLSSGGGVRGLGALDSSVVILTAGFSPDRRMLAVMTPSGLSVVSLDDDEIVARSDERPGVTPSIEWSSDSRFVVYPAVRGLDVLDAVEGGDRRVLTSYTFTGVGSLPLSGT